MPVMALKLTLHLQIPLAVGPCAPQDCVVEWATILGYLHSTEAEDLELPLLTWQALHDLLVVLLWFGRASGPDVCVAWGKFEELVMTVTVYRSGPFPDMSRWLLNVHLWMRISFPPVGVHPYV